MSILNELGKRIIFFDGGMGTLLQEAGLKPGELPELWNVNNPEPVMKIHRDYVMAGADIILFLSYYYCLHRLPKISQSET